MTLCVSDTQKRDIFDEYITMGEEKEKEDFRHQYEWMVRPCMIYKAEYDDCTSIRGRFQQYFVFGKWIDCTAWKTDYLNCYQWEKYKSEEAFNELIKNEKQRRTERLKPHYKNDVWERRDKIPENWNAPLPEWMQEKFKNTYLQMRSDEMKKGVKESSLDSKCTIL